MIWCIEDIGDVVVDVCCECVFVKGVERVFYVDVNVMFMFCFVVFVFDVGVDVYYMWNIVVGLMNYFVVYFDDVGSGSWWGIVVYVLRNWNVILCMNLRIYVDDGWKCGYLYVKWLEIYGVLNNGGFKFFYVWVDVDDILCVVRDLGLDVDNIRYVDWLVGNLLLFKVVGYIVKYVSYFDGYLVYFMVYLMSKVVYWVFYVFVYLFYLK